MKKIYCTIFVCLLNYGSEAVNRPNPTVYVVTPSPRSHQDSEARSAPFYYHNWMRRMDTPQNATTTTTTARVETPDLIFAEFESDNGDNMRKSIRKLLEQERVAAKTSTTSTTSTTTSRPIYVAGDSDNNENQDLAYVVPKSENTKDEKKNAETDMTDYFALYNNLYGDKNNNYNPAPVYLPSTTPSTTTTTTTIPALSNIENIWQIIDSEKHHRYSDTWKEVPVISNDDKDPGTEQNVQPQDDVTNTEHEEGYINDNFSLPGFAAPGNGAENESRAIRTEPNIRFPYVSLKPFVMKNMNKPTSDFFANSKKGNNMFTSLDNFQEIKHPVRGEIQDTDPMRPAIDRYNPAQPYLPQSYGSKSKQSSPSAPSSKAVSNLVPPPPPPPKATGDDFPLPTTYESFPPYPPSVVRPIVPPSPPAVVSPVSEYKPPTAIPDDSPPDSDDNSGNGQGYRYKPPSPPSFVPTLPPLSKPSYGYSYKKPDDTPDTAPAMDTDGYSYNKPTMTLDPPPSMDMEGYSYDKPPSDDKPDFHQYHYHKPEPADDHPAPSYDHHDYPELIFDKPNGAGGSAGGGDMKANDMAMMAPPPPPDAQQGMDSGPPMGDNGFPADFPDFKFHHDFDDHDFHHHYHHHTTTTTTTTTTEAPRANRFSYYYLGKKLYYLPLYFSVYFIVYVGALIIKAVLRHKIVYPNSWRPNGTTATFFSKRSVDSWDLSNENLHEVTGRVTKAIAEAAEKYMSESTKTK